MGVSEMGTVLNVPQDHFHKQFDRFEEGQPRFEAASRHAALLYNCLQEEKEKRRALLEATIERLKERVPEIDHAFELKDQLDDLCK